MEPRAVQASEHPERGGHDAQGVRLNLPTRFIMLIGGLMITIAMSAITPVLPRIADALARTANGEFMVKMLVPAVGAAMVVGAPVTGLLVDRLGFRRILVVHGLIFAVAGTAGLYVTSLEWLVASRLLVGFSAAGMATSSMTMINSRFRDATRARWMGFHISTAMFGSLLIHPLVGFLGELGWRWPFIVYATGLLVVLAVIAGLQEPEGVRSRATSEGDRPAGFDNPLAWFPLRFIPLALVMGGVTYLPMVYMPFVMEKVGVSSPSVIAMVMLADAIIGALMALTFGWSQKRMSSAAAFAFSFTCAGTGMLIVSLASSFVVVVAGMLVFGLALGWFVPNLMTALSRNVPHDRQGQSVGIIKSIHYLASPLMVVLVEPIARAFGPQGALMASACAAFSVVAIVAAGRNGRKRAAGPGAAPDELRVGEAA